MRVDSMSMAHSLEVRVPLLDRRVMDLAGRLSLDLLAPARGPPKLVLRRLTARLGAPTAILADGTKGFNAPIPALMRRELAPLGDGLFDRNADVLARFISPEGLRRLWREHRNVGRNHAFALWPLFVLAIFWSGAARAAPAAPAQAHPRRALAEA